MESGFADLAAVAIDLSQPWGGVHAALCSSFAVVWFVLRVRRRPVSSHVVLVAATMLNWTTLVVGLLETGASAVVVTSSSPNLYVGYSAQVGAAVPAVLSQVMVGSGLWGTTILLSLWPEPGVRSQPWWTNCAVAVISISTAAFFAGAVPLLGLLLCADGHLPQDWSCMSGSFVGATGWMGVLYRTSVRVAWMAWLSSLPLIGATPWASRSCPATPGVVEP